VWPNLNVAFLNIRNFIRDGQALGAIGALNTTWGDDGEALFGLTWPALVFGAGCSWQPGECSIDGFTSSYDWAFYRNSDTTFRDVILNLSRTHTLLRDAQISGITTDDMFWLDPFTQVGASFDAKAAPVMHEFRLSAEHALASLLRDGAKARAHADTLEYLRLAAVRLDVLGMKVQMANVAAGYYNDAFQNQADRLRVGRDFAEITATNARLEDLRDAITRIRSLYADAWSHENRPYWLPNVLVRYDAMAERFQSEIWAVRRAHLLYNTGSPLPPPEQLGFYTPAAFTMVPPPASSAAPAPQAQPKPPQE